MSADPSSAFNLEHLRKDAKRLLRACRAGDDAAIRSIRSVLSQAGAQSPEGVSQDLQLADVQQAMAMQRGFANWGALIRFGDPLARLLVAVRGGHLATLRRELPQFHGLAASNVFAAAALGDAAALHRHLERDASLATRSREGWTALDYACSSPLGRLSGRHAASVRDSAELLLEAGADPHSAVEDSRLPGRAISTTTRAMLAGNIGLIPVLKKHGATEFHDDFQQWTAGHQTGESAGLQEIFKDYFQRPDVREQMRQVRKELEGAPVPQYVFDDNELRHRRTPHLMGAHTHLWSALLDRGYDPTTVNTTGRSALHMLATYAPASLIQQFLDHGVDLTIRDADGRSVLATAVRAGNQDVAALLRTSGIADDATAADRLIGACLNDDAETAQELVAEYPEVLQSLTPADADEFTSAAGRGVIGHVRLLLACGFPADLADQAGATALHQAAWRGQVAVVELLLAHGASPVVEDGLYDQTPLDWARHGAMHAQGAEGPCLTAAARLEAAMQRWRA